MCQKNKDNNCSDTNKEKNKDNLSPLKKLVQGISQKSISKNYKNNLQHNKENKNIININNPNKNQNHEIKMEIEPSASNELITSGSKNYSNNTHLSIESNNINITSAKILFCPEQNNSSNPI